MSVQAIPAQEVLGYLREQQPEMVAFLKQLVLRESPSSVPESQGPVFELLSEALSRLDYRVRRIAGRKTGGSLFARPRGRERHRPAQLLLGHCDTVWPVGTIDAMPVEERDGALAGPGVYDMKCGLAQMVFALKAVHELGLEPTLVPLVFINSDEEIGSRESRRHIRRLARTVARAFVLEPSLGPTGRLKTARKGVGRFSIAVRGRAAHAGIEPEKGASAILEMSHVIQELFALNDPERGVTVNVGVVDGGLRPNVVAPECRADVDVRVLYRDDARRIEQTLLALTPTSEGTTVKVTGRVGRPPMEPTPRDRELWHLAQSLGRELGIELEEGIAGGGSDGNTTNLYTATLDGLGAVGDGAHSPDEFVYLDKMVERCALLALLVVAPATAESEPADSE